MSIRSELEEKKAYAGGCMDILLELFFEFGINNLCFYLLFFAPVYLIVRFQFTFSTKTLELLRILSVLLLVLASLITMAWQDINRMVYLFTPLGYPVYIVSGISIMLLELLFSYYQDKRESNFQETKRWLWSYWNNVLILGFLAPPSIYGLSFIVTLLFD